MSDSLLFSVVVPLFNKAGTVVRAVKSVLNQTVQDFEIIVVNDGSTDGGEKMVGSVMDSRIRLFNQTNQGVSVARNRGIKEASCNLIAFLDADDEWLPQHLERIRTLVDLFPASDIFATSYEYVLPDGRVRIPEYNHMPVQLNSAGILENYFEIAALSDPPLWTSAVVVRKTALEQIGGFPDNIVAGEDLLAWARLAARGPVAYFNAPLARFHFPVEFSARPDRYDHAQSCGTVVIQGLIELSGIVEARVSAALMNYIGRVAEMAAVVAVGSGHYGAAREYGCMAWRYGKRNMKIGLVIACSFIHGQGLWKWAHYRHTVRQSRKPDCANGGGGVRS